MNTLLGTDFSPSAPSPTTVQIPT